MLEGLEVSEVSLSIVFEQNRADSDFYKKNFIEVEQKICDMANKKLSDVASFLIGPFGSSFDTKKYLENGEYRYVRGQDVKPFILREDDNKYVPKADFIRLNKYDLKAGDILLSVVGTIGNACIVQKKNLPAIFSCKSTVIRADKLPSAYILAWLNCTYGKQLLCRRERGAIQKGLNLEDLKSLPVPLLENKNIYSKIENCVSKAIEDNNQSKRLYSEAEAYLLDCLGMTDFAANPDAYNIKTLKESFLETGRFDSEYYLPKYEDYIKLVQSYPNGYDLIGNVCDIKDNNFTPFSGVQYKYIELANIGKSGEITGCDIQDGENLPTRARRLVHQGDVIVSSIEGSLDSCALVTDEYDGALCSTGFYVLQSHQHNPETLLTLFKSLPIQNLMKKGCSGTILTAIGKSEFEKIPIPLIRKEVQEEIAKHVQKSFELRKEAMQLLENAKLTVETVIENVGGVIY